MKIRTLPPTTLGEEFRDSAEDDSILPKPADGKQIECTSQTQVSELERSSWRLRAVVIAIGLIGVATVWSYWPTFKQLVDSWERIPDYSHGYLVLPLATVFLWARRKQFPGVRHKLSWGGLALMLVSVGFRYAGASSFWAGLTVGRLSCGAPAPFGSCAE